MFNLPKSTEINREFDKRLLLKNNLLQHKDKKLIDAQISSLTITHEISDDTLSVLPTENTDAIFIVRITVSTSDFNKKIIPLLSEVIDKKIVFAIEYGDEAQFALCYGGKTYAGEKHPCKDCALILKGINLDDIWQNLIAQICQIEVEEGQSLNTALSNKKTKSKLIAKIEALNKKAHSEKQSNKKLEYFEEAKKLKKELENL